MKRTSMKRQEANVLNMECVSRIFNIPIVESSLGIAENMYGKIKRSNSIMNWTLSTAESRLYSLTYHAQPAIGAFHYPIQQLDRILCKSLDLVEQRVPSVYLPPQLMYWNTKEYMSDHLVKPVLRRADSVKHLGSAVLDSRMSNFAANRLDGALAVADKYVEKYLPDSADTSTDITDSAGSAASESKAVQTMHRVDRFSRKLQRRLTRRTLAEAKALKEQIHVIIYVAELIATDPRLALQKARELWNSLSKDEPENQARPDTVEQLLVLLTRESARRLVHLMNFTGNGVAKLPRAVVRSLRSVLHQAVALADSVVKSIYLEGAKENLIKEAIKTASKVQILIDELQTYTSNILERFAVFLAGRLDEEKVPIRRVGNSSNHMRPNNNMNNANGLNN